MSGDGNSRTGSAGSEAADGFSLDDCGGETELGGAGRNAVNAVKEDFGGQKGHVLHRLAHPGDGRLLVMGGSI